ncbi:MAG TPA: (d)CMP kinase [Clostridia bacterium]|jgi:cytidylate kinase|nr:(d)CMP kinase [Clostridia bacterium]
MKYKSIAIDGPAGSGKSLMAKMLSEQKGYTYLDTGAMYRTVALKAIRSNIDTLDGKKLEELIMNIDIKLVIENNRQHMYLDNECVDSLIRTNEVSKGASDVSKFPPVRLFLVDMQRQVAKNHNVVMEGRDIGTYVLPDADFKFFLTANNEKRAQRRLLQMQKDGKDTTYEEVLADIVYRDKQDSGRDFAPLKKADDAIEIDTSEMGIDEVFNTLLRYLNGK